MMNDLIQYAETEFGIPMLDSDFDYTDHILERDMIFGRNNCYMGS